MRETLYLKEVENTDVNNSWYEDDEIVTPRDNSKLLHRMRIAFAEYLGTGILVFISCMGCNLGETGAPIPALHLSLTSGLAVMTAIQIFAHISGSHVNPAVTLCSIIMGQISYVLAPIYIAAQVLGSLTGYALVMAVTPNHHLEATNLGHCVNLPSADITIFQAFLIEALATSVMCLAICSAWDPQNSGRTDSVALRIGFVVAVMNLTMGSYTGASMNPTRSLGPAVWNGNYKNHWIYWFAPVTGACSAGLFYRTCLLNK